MKQLIEANGVLVIAGLFDPSDQLGSAYHFDLLPVPWSSEEFSKEISLMVAADQEERKKWEYWEHLENQIMGFNDESYKGIMSRRVGIRVWLTAGKNSEVLKKALIEEGRSEKIWKEVKRIIDRLQAETLSFNFVWPGNDPEDREALSNLENALLSAIKDTCLASPPL